MPRLLSLIIPLLICSLVRAEDSPWSTIDQYPDDVDAVLVLMNPAERILLGETGPAARSSLTSFGLFTETERAWESLSDSFGMDPDECIRALLSKRVVILWDHLNATAQNPLQLLASADSRWVLSAEVDEVFVRRVRKHLKPVPRRIHQGKPIYAIEQGRFQLVIVDGLDAAPSRMIVSPRSGIELLDRVLDAFAHPAQDSSRLAERAEKTVGNADPDWVLAGVIALDQFRAADDSTDINQSDAVMSIVLHADNEDWNARIATDLQIDLPSHGAPVALLEAVGGDAVLVMANTAGLSAESSPGSFGFSLSSDSESSTGSLVIVSKETIEDTDQPSLVATVITGMGAEQSNSAAAVDQIMEGLFRDADTGIAPAFAGRFPNAIRTQSRELRADAQDKWFGDTLQCSWVHRKSARSAEGQMIFSIGPSGADTAKRVRWIREAASTIDAIPSVHERPGVVSMGKLRPGSAAPLIFADQSGVLSGLLSAIDQASWELQRSGSGLRGSVNIRWRPIDQRVRASRSSR